MTKRNLLPLLGLLLLALAPPAAGQEKAAPADTNAALEKLLEDSKATATKLRGLPFLADVPVRRIKPADLKELMQRDIRRVFGEGEKLARMEELLKVLRVLPEKEGLLALLDRFFPNTVAANYDPFSKRISFLRGFRSKSIMVHELVHALQDQHHNLALMALDGEATFDRLLALGGLVEGDAENVQRFFDTGGMMAMAPLETIEALGRGQIDAYLKRHAGIPRGIARPFIFQYFRGLLFVETVKRARDGFKSLGAVYRDPPVTTEQILHPGKYLSRDHPTRIVPPAPPAGYRVLIENVLGELGVSIVLEGHLGKEYAQAMSMGWDGDRVLLYGKEGAPTMFVWFTTWDSTGDAEEFAAAARKMFRVRRPDWPAPTSLPAPEGGVSVQERAGVAHGIVVSGKDVLLVEGMPAELSGSLLKAFSKARKEQLVLRKSRFGDE